MSTPGQSGRVHWVKKRIAPCLRPRGTSRLPSVSEPNEDTPTDSRSSDRLIDKPLTTHIPTVPPVTSRRTRLRTLSTSSQNENSEEEGEATPTKKRKLTTPQKQFNEAPDPSTMTMQDLIRYNPSANPMNSAKMTDKKKHQVAPLPSHLQKAQQENETSLEEKEDGDEQDEGRIVPQLKIAADGTIQIDEESMVVEVTHKPFEGLSETVTVDDEHVTSTSFRLKSRIKKWTIEETNQFYKALSQVGTDFTMMTLVLPHRTRKELKNKFKKEEKGNPVRVSAALDRLCSASEN